MCRRELVVFEPRYLILMQRCMEASCDFGVCSGPAAMFGSFVNIVSCRRLPYGRLQVSCTVLNRFAIVEPPEVEDNTMGTMTDSAKSCIIGWVGEILIVNVGR